MDAIVIRTTVFLLVLATAGALGAKHYRQRGDVVASDVDDPVVRVSFDGPDLPANFDKQGTIQYEAGTRENGMNIENADKLWSDCLIQADTPGGCPYNVQECKNGFTLGIWVYTDDTQFGCGGTAFDVGSVMFSITPLPGLLISEDGRLAFNMNVNGVTTFCFTFRNQTEDWLNRWTHITYRVKEGGLFLPYTLYINGTYFETKTSKEYPDNCFNFNNTVIQVHNSFMLGCKKNRNETLTVPGECGFNGKLDEFCLYDRALSEEEIEYLATPGNTCHDPQSGETENGQAGIKGNVLLGVSMVFLLFLFGIFTMV